MLESCIFYLSNSVGRGLHESGPSTHGTGDDAQQARINTSHMHELTRGKFLIQYEHLRQMDKIGQGNVALYYSPG